MPNVTIYTTPTCVYCKMAKQLFQENSVAYTEKNVLEDMQAQQDMIEKSGQMGVPVITVDDQVIVGFDKEELERLLNITPKQ